MLSSAVLQIGDYGRSVCESSAYDLKVPAAGRWRSEQAAWKGSGQKAEPKPYGIPARRQRNSLSGRNHADHNVILRWAAPASLESAGNGQHGLLDLRLRSQRKAQAPDQDVFSPLRAL